MSSEQTLMTDREKLPASLGSHYDRNGFAGCKSIEYGYRGVTLDMLTKPKNRKTAAILALVGTLAPVSGWHKFYMGRPIWGILYILLSITPIPRVASLLEGVWYLIQDEDEFNRNFNAGVYGTTLPIESYAEEMKPGQVSAIAEAVRELDRLRQEGLITEYEFEQKRRQLLDRIA